MSTCVKLGVTAFAVFRLVVSRGVLGVVGLILQRPPSCAPTRTLAC